MSPSDCTALRLARSMGPGPKLLDRHRDWHSINLGIEQIRIVDCPLDKHQNVSNKFSQYVRTYVCSTKIWASFDNPTRIPLDASGALRAATKFSAETRALPSCETGSSCAHGHAHATPHYRHIVLNAIADLGRANSASTSPPGPGAVAVADATA